MLFHKKEYDTEDGDQKKKLNPMLIGAIAIAVLAVVRQSIVVIPTGYTGVKSVFGQISGDYVPNGVSGKIPFVEKVTQVNTKQQDQLFEGQVWSETSDMTEIYYDQITVTYQILPDKAAWIVSNVTNYRDALVNATSVNSAVKAASRQLDSKEATNRGKIEPLVQKALQDSLDEKYGQQVVTVDRVVIGDANFEDSYNSAIAARQKAQIEAEQQAIENQKAIDKAEADAKVKKTQAQAAADAEVIEAQGQADANKLLNDSITDKTLKQQYIDKWDGKLPKVTSGSDVIVSMDDLDADETAESASTESTEQ